MANTLIQTDGYRVFICKLKAGNPLSIQFKPPLQTVVML